jgi:membrane-associated phospholipid phosphatase
MDTIYAIQQFASPALDTFFQLVTELGSSEVYIALLLTLYLAVDARLGQRVGSYVLFGFYLNFHLKGLVGTGRPFLIDPAVARTADAIPTSGPGFPSGHAQLALTFWGYTAWWLKRRWFWVLAVLVIALISFSRLYLGMHFMVDVVGGLAIGALYTFVLAFADPVWDSLRSFPRVLRALAGILVPLVLLLLFPPPGLEVDLIMGGLAAFLSAPLLLRYTPPTVLWRRLVAALLGLLVVFGVLIASSLLLPEAWKRELLVGFFRYLTLGYVGLWLVPFLLQRLGLAPSVDPELQPRHAAH